MRIFLWASTIAALHMHWRDRLLICIYLALAFMPASRLIKYLSFLLVRSMFKSFFYPFACHVCKLDTCSRSMKREREKERERNAIVALCAIAVDNDEEDEDKGVFLFLHVCVTLSVAVSRSHCRRQQAGRSRQVTTKTMIFFLLAKHDAHCCFRLWSCSHRCTQTHSNCWLEIDLSLAIPSTCFGREKKRLIIFDTSDRRE